MAAINSTKYQTIAQLYADAQAQIEGVSSYYYDAAYEIVLLQVFDPELDLLQPFYTAYQAVQAVFTQTPAAVVSAVGALQAHVLSKARTQNGVGRYTNVNYWIESDNSGNDGWSAPDQTASPGVYGRQNDSFDEPFTLPQRFANVSAQAGYPIDTGNIT
jgi:hypothetical protein